MAGKTLTIDAGAYRLLSRHKREGQSFSEVIKEHFSEAHLPTVADHERPARRSAAIEALLELRQLQPPVAASKAAKARRQGRP